MPTLICPHCQTPQAVSEEVFQKNRGKKCRCRQCQKTFTIEVQTPPPATEPEGLGLFDFLNDDSLAPAPTSAAAPPVPAKSKAAAKPVPTAPPSVAEPKGLGDFDFLNEDSPAPAPAPAPAKPTPAPAKTKAAAKPAPPVPLPAFEPEGFGDFDFLNEDSPAPAPVPAAPPPVPVKPTTAAKPAPAAAPVEDLDFTGLMVGHGSPPVADFLELGWSEPAPSPIAEAAEFPTFDDVAPAPTMATAGVPITNDPLTRQSQPAEADVSVIRRSPGGGIQTPLGNGVVLNPNSSITREWITISDPGIPTQFVDETGIGITYETERDGATGHFFYHAKYAVRTQVPICALEVRFLTFNLWRGHVTTLSAVEIQDFAPDKTYVFEGKWDLDSKNEACEHYASIAFVSQVRTSQGKILRPDIGPILAEAKRFSEKFSAADLEPTQRTP